MMNGKEILREMHAGDIKPVIDIFNHYAVSGFAAYPEKPVAEQFFKVLTEGAYSKYVLENNGLIVGFGLLRPFLPFTAFKATGMLTYFILPEHTRRQLGTLLLNRLTADAEAMGIQMLIVNIASKNESSIRFHEKHGFAEAGRLHNAGSKFGESFDVVWMEKNISSGR
jgi:phosphinothricin acetyltransferase